MSKKKNGRGGVRIPSSGKKIGRPPGKVRKKHSVVLGPGFKKLAEEIAHQKGYRGWGYAVEEGLNLLAQKMGLI